jgi:uncharacterized membrane-anchored protein YjiN (DUF445 family)
MLEVQDQEEKQARLNQMRRIATGMLVVTAVIFVVAHYFEARFPWVGFVRATAEAAMVGGIADWFAVTALFRYPMGIPIPHTAIVPTRKERIGRSLGRFVERNFLSPEILSAKLHSIGVAQRIAEYLQNRENASRLVRHASEALGIMVRSVDDHEVEGIIEKQLIGRIREVEATPLAADLLSMLLAGDRRKELLEGTLTLVDRLLTENRGDLRDRISREIPWWVPAPIDEKIFQKIYSATERSIHEVRMDPDHPFRGRFNELVDNFVDRLKTSPEIIARGEALKEEFLDSSALRSIRERVWVDLKEAVLSPPKHGEGHENPVEKAILGFGRSLGEDEELMATVNTWVERAVIRAAGEYRHEAALLIESTVARWDPNETSHKIELQVGRDLQFIRINGTIVGGLVGLILHTLGVVF